MKIELKVFQDKFLFSEARYPALIAGIGTGKTYMLLLKIWRFCELYPNSLALIVRKEYTDLKDSTIKDFERYFNVTVGTDKDYKLPNGSVIMFRHAAEIEVLKNINLSIFGIEQAEEFETEQQFIFLRDRLRREGSPYRQGCIIANAAGHNWIYKLWINNPKEEFEAATATTFDNADNLPKDFIDDLKRMEIEAPNHYKQYILNCFDELGSDDILFTGNTVYQSPNLQFEFTGTQRRILGIDVARFGEDETVFTVIESQDILRWQQIHQETWRNKDLMQTVGKSIDLHRQFKVDLLAIDDTGIGGGVTDRLREMRYTVKAFNGGETPSNPMYFNKRSEGFFNLKDLFDRGYLKILNESELIEQLMTIKYKFKSNGQKAIVTKDEMRKDGLKSPDRADALMMALYFKDFVMNANNLERLPREAILV